MNVCKFKGLEIFLNILRLISFKFGSGRGPPLGVLVEILNQFLSYRINYNVSYVFVS